MADFTSGFWDYYIAALTLLGIVGCGILLWAQSKARVGKRSDVNVDTTGHVWDQDLTELNTPMPRWWMGLFYITIVFGLGYLFLYPGLGSYAGSLGWTSSGAYQTELQKADGAANAYVCYFDEQRGRGHGIDYKSGPEWIVQYQRNPGPERVVWTVQPLHGVVRRQMYWLAVDKLPAATPLYLEAKVQHNVVTLMAEQIGSDNQRVAAKGAELRVYLNDSLADLDQPIELVANGRRVFAGKVTRGVATLARSLNERGDPCYMFPVEVPVRL